MRDGERVEVVRRSRWIFGVVTALALGVGGACNIDDSSASSDTRAAPEGSAGPSCSGEDCGAARTTASTISTCDTYEQSCGGHCVDVLTDPDHCGGCGNACAPGEVCSSGDCADSCADDREACDGRCVDTELDDDHCGSCGNACAAGEGCVDGACRDLSGGNASATSCKGGGPPIFTGKGTGTAGTCTGTLAKKTFRWALCSCDGVRFGNEFYTDGYDSKKGSYTKGGLGGGVGSNGPVRGGNSGTVRGALWTSSNGGVRVGNSLEIGQQIHTKGPLRVGNSGDIGGDAYVGGEVFGGNSLEIGGTLFLDPGGRVRGDVSYDDRVDQSLTFGRVCKRCSSSDRIPVGKIVRRHRSSNNDNAAIGLSADLFKGHANKRDRLDLPCGEYYLSRLDIDNGATIVAHGDAALYIAGDIEVGNSLTIEPAPGATLDVFVAGDVRVGNSIEVGDPAYPAATRFYVGGSDGWDFGNSADVAAFLYTVPGGIRGGNSLDLYGGLYTQSLRHGNSVEIHYDRQILDSGRSCPNPDDDGEGPNGETPEADAGGVPGTSPDAGGVADGGGGGGGEGAACSDRGVSCSSDSECCAPFVCHRGSCSVVECRVLGTECSADEQCCSGTCGESAEGQASCVGG